MPSVALKSPPTLESLTALFPLTSPIPTPLNQPELLTTADIHREEDLLRNPSSFRSWWTAITNTREAYNAFKKTEKPSTGELALLLGPLASSESRLSLQRLTYLYESALVQFPGSFKLWKSYLQMRMSFVLGKPILRKRAGGKKKLQEMKDALEEAQEDKEEWEGGLDGAVGWEEWKSLVATFERSLMWISKLPRLWLLYLSIFSHPLCPAQLILTHARRTYDRALRTLPPSLHARIWTPYLLFAESHATHAKMLSTVSVYRRYLAVDPSITERFTSLLLAGPTPRPLEAAKLLLGLARKARKGDYHSPESKSPYDLLGDWLKVVGAFAEEVGLSVEDTITSNTNYEKEEAAQAKAESSSVNGQLVRMAGLSMADGDTSAPIAPEVDPSNPTKQNVEHIIHSDGLVPYPDQAGRLWSGLALYWTTRGELERARATFEAGLASVLTIRDFTVVFDAYTEFCETEISYLMSSLEEEEEEDEDKAEVEQELDLKMKSFEELMDRRPFLVNDVLIRRNPNDVQEWEKRVALWGEDDDKVAATYAKALETVLPRKATANLHRLYVNFAKFYEEGGTHSAAEADPDAARKIFEKGTQVNFKAVEDLAEVWCEWAEMEIRLENYDEAIRVMQRATAVPRDIKVNYHDHSLSAQTRLFKSLKLWSFYVDLEESIGTVDSTKAVYDKILELRIANAQIIINYAAFLEENNYFEDSFRVYERGVELFTFPVSFEIWNIYLGKFVKRYGGSKLERARDLFEQALEKCPAKSCKPLFLMYAQLEEDYGLAKRSMSILDRATQVVADEDKFEMFSIYIAKATSNYGLPATRPIYERAIQVLPDRQTSQMCLRFAALERKLGEIDRARAIYAHASQFCDPRTHPNFWAEWNAFEIETGSEDTFREMLRVKRSVQAQFNTEASYLAAQTTVSREGAGRRLEEEDSATSNDPMAAAERAAGASGGFVAATTTALPKPDHNVEPEPDVPTTNADEIHISDDEDI